MDIQEELDKLTIKEDALMKRYYALLADVRLSSKRSKELRRLENQIAAVQKRIAALKALIFSSALIVSQIPAVQGRIATLEARVKQ